VPDDLPAAIGPYPVLRRLGSGGMAEVLLCRSLGASGFERLVAVKRPLLAFRGEGELERLLIAEARVGARIAHRNLVAVHGLGLHDGTYYVVMDYVEGADLDTLRHRHPPRPPSPCTSWPRCCWACTTCTRCATALAGRSGWCTAT
jgi:serine/threonine protein kinase